MDRPSTSLEAESPDAKLILYADLKTKKLVECRDSKLKPAVNLGKLQLNELVQEEWFQDNTLLFDTLLRDKSSFVMCVYPPGSGKSTMAQLLKYYLSRNGIPTEILTFLNGCKFQQKENVECAGNPSYESFRASAAHVLVADFSEMKGSTYNELELNYMRYMGECWMKCGLPDQTVNEEIEALNKDQTVVWTSLLRLKIKIELVKGNLYVILDSLDNMYNLIANLSENESKKLYARFTDGVATLIHKGTRNIKTFCFGVSPYLIHEFQKYAVSCYFIGSDQVGEYFSYQDTSIKRIIDFWSLKISPAQCKEVAAFKYNNNHFVNPYLCVSYLKSLRENGARFEVNLSPRSLWMKCIFSKEDIELLYNVLRNDRTECQFPMAVSMQTMCVLPQKSDNRKLYYPLFIFGAYLSCEEIAAKRDSYFVSSANAVTKILLRFHLNSLHPTRFGLTIGKSHEIFDYYATKQFSMYCEEISKGLAMKSCFLSKGEDYYHAIMTGITMSLQLRGYKTEHDRDFGPIRPDSIIDRGTNLPVVLEEYKWINDPKVSRKRGRAGKSMKLEDIKKVEVIQACKEKVVESRLNQISVYAPAISTLFKNDVEVNLMLFYIIHVLLLHCKYSFKEHKFSAYEIFSSTGYFDLKDLNVIKNAK